MLFIDWDRCAGDPEWVRGLVELLATEPGPPSSLPLRLAVKEVEDWARLATPETWRAKANRKALAADLEVSASRAGRRLRSLLSPALDAYLHWATQEFAGAGAIKCAAPEGLGEELLESIVTPDAVAATWLDLVDAVRQASDDDAAWSRHCLMSQLTASGPDGSRSLQEAAWYVVGQELRRREGPVPALAMRLERAGEALTRAPSTRDCVVWLTYERADLREFVATFGPVTLIEADWALPNAIRDGGFDFAHRDELRALAASGRNWSFDEKNWTPDPSRRPYVVLARVELGKHPVGDAVEEAARRVQLMLDVARLRGSGTAWRRRSPSYLVANGEVLQEWGPPSTGDVEPPDPSAHYGRNLFAESLAEHGPLVGRLLATKIAPDLAEAVRMLGEAGQADEPRQDSSRIRAIDERTVLALHDAAHDHLATFGRLEDAAELEERLVEEWPMRAWRANVMRAIQACLSDPREADDELARAVRVNLTYHFDIASDRRNELLERVADSRTERIAARWLLSISDAEVCVSLLADLAADVAILKRRFQRVRNGTLHGTPASLDAVASVMEYSTYRVFGALWYAMEAATSDRSMRELLDEERARHGAERQKLVGGVSLLEQWRDRSTDNGANP